MSEKTRRALSPGNLTLLGRAVRSVFAQTDRPTNGTRRWESRGSERRAAIHELRVEEARDYLDIFIGALRKLNQVKKVILHSRRTTHKAQTLKEIELLTGIAGRQKYRMEVLRDPVLNDLNEKLGLLVWEEYGCIAELMKIVENRGSIQKDRMLDKVSESNKEAFQLVTAMQVRLNQVAQTIPY